MRGYRENFELADGQTEGRTDNGHFIRLSVYQGPKSGKKNDNCSQKSVFYEKAALKNFVKFTRKQLC